MLDLSYAQLAFAMLLVFLGCFVQTTVGFGLAIVSAPFLIQLSELFVPGPITFVALVLSLKNAYKFRRSISLSGLKHAVLGRVFGSLCGGLLLFYSDVQQLTLLIGVLVLLSVVLSLLPIQFQPTPNRLILAGYFSGLFGTSSSIGGPPMALLLQHQSADIIRGNLSAFFVVSSLISLIIQVPIGYMGTQHLLLALLMLPAAVLGYKIAALYMVKLPLKSIRYCSLSICFIAGSYAIYSALMTTQS